MAKSKSDAPARDPLPPEVGQLVERFTSNREAYRRGTYNEAQLRREFIDPLFKALGWDIDNTAGYAEAYKDVIHEDSIRIGGAVKAPDYCFRIGGARKFFLEAKKPSVDIKGDPTPAYQLRRYAWSGKLPLSILTDFEEFAVYDCRVKPDKSDKSSTARIVYYTFDQFTDPKVWGEIASVFSREAILKGSFDKYAQSTRRKKGTAEVDEAFLAEIESWRDELARNLALRNADISSRQLNAAVQLTVDRIIFLRICEDRGIEDYGRLQALLNGERIYQRLFEIFEQADRRYNSGLFYFKVEKGRGEPDTLTPGLTIDDKVLKAIIKGLYYPDSPYEFSVLSADILGHVYEQFLGKVIRLTKGHRAQIEEKPEVRKAGGVYYTPTYIVDYIVTHTVGKLLEDASVKWIGTERGKAIDRPRLDRSLRILDPACGSGSFLIGAYQHLLDWHLKWYLGHEPEKWAKKKKPPIAANQRGEHRLTTPERKRILLEHIYGVDIDAQAVEVTKLSLLLKVLEGETAHSLGTHLWYEKERALPDLSSNIKCGNSLIGPDFYDNQQLPMFDDEERYRINAFDWKAEFPEVFGGSSAPTSRAREEAVSDDRFTTKAQRHEEGIEASPTSRAREEADASADEAKPPHAHTRGPSGEGGFDAVIGNPPYIDIIGIPKIQREYFSEHYNTFAYRSDILCVFFHRGIDLLTCSGYVGYITSNVYMTSSSSERLRRHILERVSMDVLIDIGGGVFSQANVDTAIFIGRRESPSDSHEVAVAACGSTERLKDALSGGRTGGYGMLQQHFAIRPAATLEISSSAAGHDIIARIHAERSSVAGDWLEFSRGYTAYDAHRGHTKEMIRKRVFHADTRQSNKHRKELVGSDIGRYLLNVRSPLWVEFGDNLAAPRHERFHGGPRVWIQRIRNPKLKQRLVCYFTAGDDDLAASGGLTIGRATQPGADVAAFCGLMNSRLINWWFRQHFNDVNIKPRDLVKIPLPASWAEAQSRLADDVQRIQGLHKGLAGAKTGHERTVIERDIETTDRQIDRLVYDLYGLTAEEIAVVEEAAAAPRE